MNISVYEYTQSKPKLLIDWTPYTHPEKPIRTISCKMPLDKFWELIGDSEKLVQRILELDNSLFN